MNTGCKTDTDTGTFGPWRLGIGLGRAGLGFGVYDKRWKATTERWQGYFGETLRRRTDALRHRLLGIMAPNITLAGVTRHGLIIGFFLYSLSGRGCHG